MKGRYLLVTLLSVLFCVPNISRDQDTFALVDLRIVLSLDHLVLKSLSKNDSETGFSTQSPLFFWS